MVGDKRIQDAEPHVAEKFLAGLPRLVPATSALPSRPAGCMFQPMTRRDEQQKLSTLAELREQTAGMAARGNPAVLIVVSPTNRTSLLAEREADSADLALLNPEDATINGVKVTVDRDCPGAVVLDQAGADYYRQQRAADFDNDPVWGQRKR